MSERLERPGECCEVLKLVLSRATPMGLSVGSMINFETGKTRDVLVVNFRKAKKGEPQEHKNATYAPVNYCPFCGTRAGLEEPSTETAAASGTTRRTPQKERAR